MAKVELGSNSLNNNRFTVFSNDPALSIKDKFSCLELLQMSVDLKDMMNNFASLVAKLVRPFNIRFQSAHGFFSFKHENAFHYSDHFNLAIASDNARIGSLTYQSSKALSIQESKLLTELHLLLIPNLKNALKFSELNAMVFKDHLTKIGNRAYYDESINRAIEQSSRNHQCLSLMVLDINNFKIINDTLGHLTGDQVLQSFSGVLIKSVRTSDMVFRLGGDEFAVILQPGGHISVSKVMSRLQQEIKSNTLLKDLHFSSSVGFSHWQMGITANELFSVADQKLYINKIANKQNR